MTTKKRMKINRFGHSNVFTTFDCYNLPLWTVCLSWIVWSSWAAFGCKIVFHSFVLCQAFGIANARFPKSMSWVSLEYKHRTLKYEIVKCKTQCELENTLTYTTSHFQVSFLHSTNSSRQRSADQRFVKQEASKVRETVVPMLREILQMTSHIFLVVDPLVTTGYKKYVYIFLKQIPQNHVLILPKLIHHV